ncbi:MAG: DUF4148 domain-containing protein [Alcaligenes sp.]
MKSIARTAILGLSLSAAALMGTANAASAPQGEQLDYPVIAASASQSSQQIQQELADAQAKGLVSAGAMNDYPQLSQGTKLTREQVAASTNEWNSTHGDFVAF